MSNEIEVMEAAAAPLAKGTVAPEAKTSKGEKLFDFSVYSGIAGAGVFLATLPITYWAKHGSGQKVHQWMTGALKKKGLSESAAEQIFNTTVLGLAGNAAVIPIKAIENKKAEIVKTLNEQLGDTSGNVSVENEPKQSWGSLIKSRVAAYAAVWLSFQGAVSMFGAKRFGEFEEGFAKKIVCEPLGKPTHINGQETKLFRYGKIAALDSFATVAAATLLYIGSRFFVRGNEEKIDNHPDGAPNEMSATNVQSSALPQPSPPEPSTRKNAASFTEKHKKTSSFVERTAPAETAPHPHSFS